MKSVLKRKLKHLFCGDDGAALVITLGVFFFMYIFCAGVYAIGMAVKERIQLQNACDAAAYSAAVVQADTISRIATLNRAMAWTYSQLCKRQMDYIVYKLARHTADHYNRDLNAVKLNRILGGAHQHPCWWRFKPDNDIFPSLGDRGVRWNNQSPVKVNGVDGLDESCRYFLRNYLTGDSYYAPNLPPGQRIERLREQIKFDKSVIVQMNREISTLMSGLPGRIDKAANSIARANLPQHMEGLCKMVVARASSPMGDCFSYMSGAKDEQLFLSWSGDVSLPSFVDWLPLAGGEGFLRSYRQDGECLSSHWTWEAYQWHCSNIAPCWYEPIITSCSHGTCKYGDNCGMKKTHSVNVTAEDLRDGDECYEGARAKPVRMMADYFGRAGTITVGLMRKATSPWAPILGAVTRGFYSAFNPYCDTYCFASAKAGYKLYSTQEAWELPRNGRTRAVNGDRDYCIDYKFTDPCRTDEIVTRIGRNGRLVPVMELVEGIWRRKRIRRGTPWRHNWNLAQSDWDAVLLPVRQSRSAAEEERMCTLTEWRNGKYWYRFEPVWNNTVGRRLKEIRDPAVLQKIVQDGTWSDLDGTVSLAGGQFDDMFAGGEHDSDPNGDWGENFITKTSAGWNGWWDISKTQADHSERVQSRWNIENQHGRLEWENLTRLMFH